MDSNINQYYSNIDKNILNNLCQNENTKSLLFLSSISNLNIFNKNNQIKSKKKILKNCESIKKKYIKTSSVMLSNLSKLNITDAHKINNIYDDLKYKINNIDEIIKTVDNISDTNTRIIECYSNC